MPHVEKTIAASRTWFASLALMLALCPAANAQSGPSAVPHDKLSFEVATVKPTRPDSTDVSWDSGGDRVSIQNYTLRQLIKAAYDIKSDSQILSGPEWMSKQRFDIAAKIDDDEVAKLKKMSRAEREQAPKLMLQALLAQRFQLKVRMETRSLPIYGMVVNKPNPKLAPSSSSVDGHSLSTHNGHMTAVSVSMDRLADSLGQMREIGDRVVLNRTGLNGSYDFELSWTPDYGNGIPTDANDPGLFTALREQLGLKLEPQSGPVPVIVVDAAAQPIFD
jgi:uncharacterized protein (TIGR03435 family)